MSTSESKSPPVRDPVGDHLLTPQNSALLVIDRAIMSDQGLKKVYVVDAVPERLDKAGQPGGPVSAVYSPTAAFAAPRSWHLPVPACARPVKRAPARAEDATRDGG